jgi:hypothetical protein
MTKRKRWTLVALAATTLTLTACTPAQLKTLERLTGWTPTPTERRELIAAPDIPIGVVEGEILPDGTVRPWQAPAGSKCPQWYGTARLAGWPAHEWERLDYVMWRESRCDPSVLNDNPSTGDYSISLLQVNIKPGIGTRPFIGPLVDYQWDRLYDPYTNLWVGRRMYELFSTKSWSNYCGWWGWSARNRSWCG